MLKTNATGFSQKAQILIARSGLSIKKSADGRVKIDPKQFAGPFDAAMDKASSTSRRVFERKIAKATPNLSDEKILEANVHGVFPENALDQDPYDRVILSQTKAKFPDGVGDSTRPEVDKEAQAYEITKQLVDNPAIPIPVSKVDLQTVIALRELKRQGRQDILGQIFSRLTEVKPKVDCAGGGSGGS